MWDKVIRSMFQGNTKTKIFLWSILILGLAAAAMLVVSIALALPQLGMGAVALGFVSFIVSQSVSIDTLEKDRKTKNGKPKTKNQKTKKSKTKKHKDKMEQEEDPLDPKAKERTKARFLASLNEKSVKKMLREHKVVQTHVKVMIDSYAQRRLEQVPAFAWRTEDHLHFLVLEGHANEFEIPLNQIQGIYYEKNVEADPEKDYAPFQYGTFIAKLFAPYLPEYHEYTQEGAISYRKHLFRVGQDIYITNSSMANMMSILPRVPFLIDDQVCRSSRFDEYFKELYRYSILCKNQVISLEEYKKQIDKTLESLLTAPISAREFVQSMRAMSRYHLIDQENVTKYSQKYRLLKEKTQ